MPRHCQETRLDYSVQQLFEMVADVSAYQEFLPWCAASRILKRESNRFTAELVIRFKGFRSSYTSRVTLHPPRKEGDTARILVELVEGPFEYLTNCWEFYPEDGGCRVAFELDFRFASPLLERMIGGMYHRAVEKMVEAFSARAAELYG